MLAQIKAVLKNEAGLRPGATLLLALSGGQDSVALGHGLLSLRQELGFNLAAAHLNHCLRGAAADEDEAFVKALCERWGIACITQRLAVADLGGNVEDTARRVRYRFLRQQKEILGAAYIVTAHHGGDQAETLLLHLVRGCGLAGLGGMAPLAGDLLRPMLAVTPAQIDVYCAQHGLCWREDQTNQDCALRRNSLRQEVLPKLTAYNPRVLTAFGETAAICRTEQDCLAQLTQAAAADLLTVFPDHILLAGEGTAQLHPALARRLLRLAYERLTGSTALTYDLCLQVLALHPGRELCLTGGVYCRRTADHWELSLTKPAKAPGLSWGPDPQPVPGALVLPAAGWFGVAADNGMAGCPAAPAQLSCGVQTAGCPAAPAQLSCGVQTAGCPAAPAQLPADVMPACDGLARIGLAVQAEIVPLPYPLPGEQSNTLLLPPAWQTQLQWRNRRPGDRFCPRNFEGHQKIKEFLIDRKIPAMLRDQVPLLLHGEEIIWLPGLRQGQIPPPVGEHALLLTVTALDSGENPPK